MTCIVGFVDKNKDIYLGGDSAGTSGHNLDVRKDVKVWKKGEMVFGYTSSFRMGQLLRFKLDIPDQPKKMNDYEFMCTLFIDRVRRCLRNNGYAKINNNVEEIGEFLVGYKAKIYHIYSDCQVGINEYKYDSCGCGRNYAMGSLATNDSKSAKEIVLKALEIAEKFSTSVRRPFKIIKLKYEGGDEGGNRKIK